MAGIDCRISQEVGIIRDYDAPLTFAWKLPRRGGLGKLTGIEVMEALEQGLRADAE